MGNLWKHKLPMNTSLLSTQNGSILKGKAAKERRTLIKSEQFHEFIMLEQGPTFDNQKKTFIYNFKSGHHVGLAKPGKEVFEHTKKYKDGHKSNNPNDMTPKVFLNFRPLEYDQSFNGIFKAFVPLFENEYELQLIGALLFRMAFMLDHKRNNDGNWRYSPPLEIVEQIEAKIPSLLGMPFRVFLFYLEMLACNEDVKYKTLGYDTNDSGGYGRRNNVLTYCNVIDTLILRNTLPMEEFLLAFMEFASKFSRVPVGISAIGQKRAIIAFPQLL